MEEFEIKFLEVNVPELEKKLLAIGAKKVGEYSYRRALMDYPDLRMDSKNSWLRLRTDGLETTLTYKKYTKSTDEMKEVEVSVDDYDKTYEILESIGLIVKREEKNKRLRYVKGDVVYDIDTWPHIPTFLEIESTSIKRAQEAAVGLGFDIKNSFINSVKEVYKKYGFNLDEYRTITFEKMVKK